MGILGKVFINNVPLKFKFMNINLILNELFLILLFININVNQGFFPLENGFYKDVFRFIF